MKELETVIEKIQTWLHEYLQTEGLLTPPSGVGGYEGYN